MQDEIEATRFVQDLAVASTERRNTGIGLTLGGLAGFLIALVGFASGWPAADVLLVLMPTIGAALGFAIATDSPKLGAPTAIARHAPHVDR